MQSAQGEHRVENFQTKIILDILKGQGMPLENETMELLAQLQHQATALEQLHKKLAERDLRIAMLELELNAAAKETSQKATALRKIRQVLEGEVAQSRRDNELAAILDDLESAVSNLYGSRRWRIFNFLPSLRSLFSPAAHRGLPGYWRIDVVLGRYRAWCGQRVVPKKE